MILIETFITQVFTKTCKGHPHETIALPTISLRKTLDDLCPSDEDEFGEEEKELGTTHPVKVSTCTRTFDLVCF